MPNCIATLPALNLSPLWKQDFLVLTGAVLLWFFSRATLNHSHFLQAQYLDSGLGIPIPTYLGELRVGHPADSDCK